MSKVLFVVGGLGMGGVETYILRLARSLAGQGHQISVLVLSAKGDPGLVGELKKFAKVRLVHDFPMRFASNWIVSYLSSYRKDTEAYDVVHVVDLLTLGYVYFNRNRIRFKFLSIGVYHSREPLWWRNRKVYFREKLTELYDRNISLSLFPSESVARLIGERTNTPVEAMNIVPIGIDLSKYESSMPSKKSKRIVSVGRLVDFKVYNKHMIAQLGKIRNLGDFQYYIYGDGPELNKLKKLAKANDVDKFVHFMGEVRYRDLPSIFDNAFCFVGSGTAIIEASAAGIPSIVGIESISSPFTCGFFSDVVGYSYNEEVATSKRVSFFDTISLLCDLDDLEYLKLSNAHREKASEFDINRTAKEFLDRSNGRLDASIRISRWVSFFSFLIAIIRYGPKSFRSRLDNECN